MPRRLSLLVVLAVAAACGPADDAGDDARRSSAPTDSAVPVPGVGDAASPSTSGGVSGSGDSVRVVFLGTSLTAGLGLSRNAERFTDRLAGMADSAGLPVRTVNAGVSGETSAGGLRRLDWVLEEPLDVLVVELGANDGLRGQDPAAMEANLRAVVERTRSRYPDAAVVLVGMEAPPNLGERYASAFRDVFPTLAAELDTPLVPFLLDGVAGVPTLNQSDGIHPTAEGHRRMARNVWPVLEPVLRRELARRADAASDRSPDGQADDDAEAGEANDAGGDATGGVVP